MLSKKEILFAVVGVFAAMATLAWALDRALTISGY